MAGKMHVKKGDTVVIIAGKDINKKGKVLQVFPSDRRVIVEGVNIITKHTKPRGRGQQGGIIKQEAPIDGSNVMLICPRCDTATRIGRKVLDNGRRARVCKKCGDVVDIVRESKEETADSSNKPAKSAE